MICTIDLSTMTPLLDHNPVLLPAASIRPLYTGLDFPIDISVLIECTRKVHFHQHSSQAQQRYPTKTRLMTRGRKLDNKLDSSSFFVQPKSSILKIQKIITCAKLKFRPIIGQAATLTVRAARVMNIPSMVHKSLRICYLKFFIGR